MTKLAALLLPFLLVFNDSELNTIRNSYFNATTAEGVREFREASLQCTENSALCKAYQGAALAMSAGFSPGLMNRIELFNDGKALIEAAVEEDATDAEIRFIRYSIQANVPSILFYSSELDEDLEMIEKHLKSVGKAEDFWKEAIRVMSVSERVSNDHRSRLEQLNKRLK